jgi:hypothetical protein
MREREPLSATDARCLLPVAGDKMTYTEPGEGAMTPDGVRWRVNLGQPISSTATPRRAWRTTGRGLGLGLVGRRLFQLLSQFHIFLGDFVHLLLGIRVLEVLGFGQNFFGAVSRVPREEQKPLVWHWSALSPTGHS